MAKKSASNSTWLDSPKVRPLTVYLLKSTVKNFKDATENDIDVETINLRSDLTFQGVILRERTEKNPPSWKAFLQEGTDDPLNGLTNQHQSVLLLVKPRRCKRIFAFTFGYAKSLLNQSACESDFGLKVVMNVVDPDKLRSMDAAQLEEIPVHTRKQASKVSALELFDVNRDSDMLRALTGTPREALPDGTIPRLGNQVAGSSSLLIRPSILFPELGDLSQELLGFYERKDYRTYGFEWVDHLRPLKDHELIDQLDSLLMQAVLNKDAEQVSLTPPEPVNWEDFSGIRFANAKKNEFPNFQIEELYQYMDSTSGWGIDDLKRVQVHLLDVRSGQSSRHFPIYRCLAYSQRWQGKQYVLTGGAWFNIDVDFANRVTAFIETLPEAAIDLPDFQKGMDKDEGAYTMRACAGVDGFVLMDKRLVKPTSARTSIEVCDIFTKNRQFVHVKPYKGSSNLSHLFAQGHVSADLFQMDPGYRKKARKLVSHVQRTLGDLIPEDTGIIPVSSFEVVFAIIKKPHAGTGKWQHTLPFFSQLHLMQTAEALQAKTYRVAVKLIRSIP